MTLVGAIMAPRWTYIEPSIAFNATISFEVVIMALLGGAHRLWGPALGAIPLTLLFEFLAARFPTASTLIMGVIFLLIVYALPAGVVGLWDNLRRQWRPQRARAGGQGMMPAASTVLEIKGLVRAFGGLVAVNALDMTVRSGEIVGLLGPNGSGKTTALNLVSGVLRPDSGVIHFAGRILRGWRRTALRVLVWGEPFSWCACLTA